MTKLLTGPYPVLPPTSGPVHINRPPTSGPIKKKYPTTGGGLSKPPVRRKNDGSIRKASADKALANVTLALKNGGLNQTQATHYAKVLLTQPGVQIGPHSNIMYKGKEFRPDAFAHSNLAQYVTGAKAQALNQKAITTDPGYLQALASLGLARQDAISPLQDSERQAIIQYGDPSFAGGDQLVGGAAAANPFSTVALQQLQFGRNLNATNQNANQLGTYYGGGRTSGLHEDQRQYAANSQDAQIKMNNLLQQINQQIGSANQAYNVGKSGAQLDAYNNLLSLGAIHASTPPNLQAGQFHYNGFTPPPPPNTGKVV